MIISATQLKKIAALADKIESLCKPWRAKYSVDLAIAIGLSERDNSTDNAQGYAPTAITQVCEPIAVVGIEIWQLEDDEHLIPLPSIPTLHIPVSTRNYDFYVLALEKLLEDNAPTEEDWKNREIERDKERQEMLKADRELAF